MVHITVERALKRLKGELIIQYLFGRWVDRERGGRREGGKRRERRMNADSMGFVCFG